MKKRKECQKKKRRKSKKDKSARVHGCLCFFLLCFFFSFKKSTKAKTKGITDTDLSQEKTQDQRNLDFWTWFPFSSPCRRKRLPLFYGPLVPFSLSLKPHNVPWDDTFSFFLFFFSVLRGEWLMSVNVSGVGEDGGKKGKVEVRRSLRFEEQDPHLSSSHVKRWKKDKLNFFFFFWKKRERRGHL